MIPFLRNSQQSQHSRGLADGMPLELHTDIDIAVELGKHAQSPIHRHIARIPMFLAAISINDPGQRYTVATLAARRITTIKPQWFEYMGKPVHRSDTFPYFVPQFS